MKFASIRLVTADLDGLIAFYEALTGVVAVRVAPPFAELRLPGATLALCTEDPIRQFNGGIVVAGANRSALIEFEVDDVDAVRARLDTAVVAMEPSVMPWGNRSMLLRDPDGNAVNIFSRPKA